MVSTIWASTVLLPFSRPSATAARMAFSISCCEVTPTTLRNLRSDMLRASSFIALSLRMASRRAYDPRHEAIRQESAMNEEALNMSLRKFLKVVGVAAQQENE